MFDKANISSMLNSVSSWCQPKPQAAAQTSSLESTIQAQRQHYLKQPVSLNEIRQREATKPAQTMAVVHNRMTVFPLIPLMSPETYDAPKK